MADQVIELKDGKVIENYKNINPTPVADIEW
jgi:hypothetical protein